MKWDNPTHLQWLEGPQHRQEIPHTFISELRIMFQLKKASSQRQRKNAKQHYLNLNFLKMFLISVTME